MTTRLKYRWFAVGLIWGLVMALSGWNIHRIGRVQEGRRTMETMQMDLRFLKANQPVIQEIRLQKSRLIHLVQSDDLGFLVVENNLKRLSWSFGLQKLSVETDKNAEASTMMPIRAVALGTVPAVAGWLTAVEEAYPYLVIKQMELVYESATRTGRLHVLFDYHFAIPESGPVI